MSIEVWAAAERQRDAVRGRFRELFSECFDFSPPPGWLGIVEKLSEKLSADKSIRCVQVKVKFGGLRYYLEAGAPAWAEEAVRAAEEEASRTCELCGAPASPPPGGNVGWVYLLCVSCREKK